MIYKVDSTNSFKKSIKRAKKQGKDLSKLEDVIFNLARGKKLDIKYKDHMLRSSKHYKNCRECHIEPDWVLIYKYERTRLYLILVEIGSHSELFSK